MKSIHSFAHDSEYFSNLLFSCCTCFGVSAHGWSYRICSSMETDDGEIMFCWASCKNRSWTTSSLLLWWHGGRLTYSFRPFSDILFKMLGGIRSLLMIWSLKVLCLFFHPGITRGGEYGMSTQFIENWWEVRGINQSNNCCDLCLSSRMLYLGSKLFRSEIPYFTELLAYTYTTEPYSESITQTANYRLQNIKLQFIARFHWFLLKAANSQ